MYFMMHLYMSETICDIHCVKDLKYCFTLTNCLLQFISTNMSTHRIIRDDAPVDSLRILEPEIPPGMRTGFNLLILFVS